MNWIIYNAYMLIITFLCYLIKPVLEAYSKQDRDPFSVYIRRSGNDINHSNLWKNWNITIYIRLNCSTWCFVKAESEKRIVSGKTDNIWYMQSSRNFLYAELTRIISLFYHVPWRYLLMYDKEKRYKAV